MNYGKLMLSQGKSLPLPGAIRSVTSGITVAIAIGPSPYRTALVISPPVAGQVTISDDPNVTLGGGLTFSLDGGRMTLLESQFGALVQRQLFAIASAGATVWGFAEAFGYHED
jgi:hypothetical protein